MGRSSAALTAATRISNGVIHLTILLIVSFNYLTESRAQHDEIAFNPDRNQPSIDNPLGQELDISPEARKLQPFNLIAPRPSCE